MFVNRYILNNNTSGSTGHNINLPLNTSDGMLGQQEIIDKDFIDTEVKNAVNVIFDYEKVKLLPVLGSGLIKEITYNINLLQTDGITIIGLSPITVGTTPMVAIETSSNHNLNVNDKVVILNKLTSIFNKEFEVKQVGNNALLKKETIFVIEPTTIPTASQIADNINITLIKKVLTNWASIGFNDDDLKSRKNFFTKSFLQLDFYDSDMVTNQNLMSFISLYPKTANQVIPLAMNYKLSFILGNPIIDEGSNGEGFSLYHFKDEVLPNPLPPKYLYMRATFNNAKTGKSNGFMSTINPNLSIDDLIEPTADDPLNIITITNKNNLFTRYILIRTNDGYFYEIDTEYSSNNVTYDPSNKSYTINLYEISSK